MPDMDGVTASRTIRRHTDKQIANIPIIALTANANPGQSQEYLAAGIDQVVCKPLEISELLDTIQVLNQRSRESSDEAILASTS